MVAMTQNDIFGTANFIMSLCPVNLLLSLLLGAT